MLELASDIQMTDKGNNILKTKTSEMSVLTKNNENGCTTEAADFETAASATGFGRYNLILILIALPTNFALLFETTNMAYVFPVAQCDLDLSLDDKGFLNAASFLGMISSALIWGYLYDTLGRKKLMIVGYSLDAIFMIMSSVAQNKVFLMATTFLGGMSINGPTTAFMTYFCEFHCAKHRGRMQAVLGAILSSGNIVLPLLAWVTLPQDIHFTMFGGSLKIHAWNIFLLLCSLPSLLSAILLTLIPESPKFLMAVGRNEEALEVFKKMYNINTGKSPETYPVKVLVDELELSKLKRQKYRAIITANRTKMQAIKEGWQQMKPLFFPPYLANFIIVCSIETILMISLNTLRLWVPQLFQAMNDYEYKNNGTSTNFCTMLEMIEPSMPSEDCTFNANNNSVYINSIIVSTVSALSFLLVGYFINILGKKKLLIIIITICGTSACCMYFAPNSATMTALTSVFVGAGTAAITVVFAVVVDIFPTTLRTMTVSIDFTLGRCGSMLGNLAFPALLRTGCAPPFFTIGSLIMGSAILSFFLPNSDFKSLE